MLISVGLGGVRPAGDHLAHDILNLVSLYHVMHATAAYLRITPHT